MREPRLSTFTGRREFHAAILEVLATSRHSIVAVDRDFEAWPLESALGEETLRRALRRGATLRLLVAQPDWLERHGARFMRVRRTGRHAAAIAKLLAQHGFTPVRESQHETWFVRASAEVREPAKAPPRHPAH